MILSDSLSLPLFRSRIGPAFSLSLYLLVCFFTPRLGEREAFTLIHRRCGARPSVWSLRCGSAGFLRRHLHQYSPGAKWEKSSHVIIRPRRWQACIIAGFAGGSSATMFREIWILGSISIFLYAYTYLISIFVSYQFVFLENWEFDRRAQW